MRILLQRVSRAEVRVGDRVTGAIGRGFLLLVGFTHTDTEAELAWMADKVIGLRLFSDAEDKMNLALADVEGALLVVSQFTLYGDAAKGRRPSFIDAARPEVAIPLYERFVALLRERGVRTRDRRVRGDDGRGTGERRPGDAVAGTVMRPRVVLASASPRRRDLLTLIGIPARGAPRRRGRDAASRRVAGRVRRAAGAREGDRARRPRRRRASGATRPWWWTARCSRKPESEADAARMLRRLSGRSHVVLTGVAVAWQGRVASAVEEVGVTFRALSDDDIARYIATGEPMDKAGSYGIQGYGATIVTRVDGDYFAVMGLAVNRMVRLFEHLGLRYPFGPLEAPRP